MIVNCFSASSRVSSSLSSATAEDATNKQELQRLIRPAQVSKLSPKTRPVRNPTTLVQLEEPPVDAEGAGQDKVGQVMFIAGVAQVTAGQLTEQSGHGGHC